MSERTIAYVLKGYPRISELFIASEIWRLEQLGVPVRLFVLKAADEDRHHPVVDRIRAVPTYLPATTPLSDEPLLSWLRANLHGFAPALRRVARRHPLRLVRATAAACAQSVRARTGWAPKRIYVKELLQAVALADAVSRASDVVQLHGHFAHGTATVTWLAGMISGLPYSFTAHAKDIYRPSLNPAGLLARKMRGARFVVTCTGANHAHLHDLAPHTDVHLVHHGLNADFARLVEAAASSDCDRAHAVPRILSVGRLVPKKGFDVLIDAIALLRARGITVELVIAGEPGPSGEQLRRQVRDAGLEDLVRFAGVRTQSELFADHRSATAFVLACRVGDDGDRDGIPNVLMEAMAAGTPVVSTDVSGIPELIDDGCNGLLVPPESPEALAEAIGRLIDDPALATELATSGRRTIAERFDGERLAHRMAAPFAPALGGGR